MRRLIRRILAVIVAMKRAGLLRRGETGRYVEACRPGVILYTTTASPREREAHGGRPRVSALHPSNTTKGAYGIP